MLYFNFIIFFIQIFNIISQVNNELANENEFTECWRQFACPPDQQSHCLAAILDDVDGVRVGHALCLVAIYLQNLVAHLLQRLYT